MNPITTPLFPADYPLTPADNDGLSAAGDKEATSVNAEYIRLKEEMQKLASRNAWKGVEDNFDLIIKLDGVSIEASVYMLAAYAARSLGDTYAFYMRCQATLTANPNEATSVEAQGNVAEIRANYGLVSITVPNPSFALSLDEWPFPPDQKLSITSANTKLAETKTFTGLLPANMDYTLSSSSQSQASLRQTFRLDPMGDNSLPQAYKTVLIENSNLGEHLVSKAHKPRRLHGEVGVSAGYQSLAPTYGNSYSLDGAQSALFAGGYYDSKLGQHLLIRAGLRATYSTSVVRSSEPGYALADSALMGAARLSGIYDFGRFGIGASASLSHGFHFTNQGEIDPVIGTTADTRVAVGSADVALNNVNIVQTPLVGAGLLLQYAPQAGGSPLWLEVNYQQAIIGLEGTLEENPEWNSAAPFLNQQSTVSLGIGF